MTDKETIELIETAIEAVDDEIDAVREQPSQAIFFDGHRRDHSPPGTFYYKFETDNRSIRFAEVIRAELPGSADPLEVHPVEADKHAAVLEFPHNVGEDIPKVRLEWENDFILKRLKWELEILANEHNEKARERIQKLFAPDAEQLHHPSEKTRVVDDSRRNKSQNEALIKSNQNDVLFVWGPPGTGKTSTLGFMMANYLVKGKRVLFASNTNRAVDVGLLSALDALESVEKEHLSEGLTRFGEIALESPRLEAHLFDKRLEKREKEQKQKAAELTNVLEKYQHLQKQVDELLGEDDPVPDELESEINLLGKKVDKYGGEESMELTIDDMVLINEAAELKDCMLVGTTLARICTSDLFNQQKFDAVVVDEASMANLPYLMVLAAKAQQHIVVVGDPMQLPPIALTKEPKSRRFLEQDIFMHVSKAKSTEDLFTWHDENRPITTFFDTQYRLKRDLARVLSTVFYDDRLKTIGDPLEQDFPEDSHRSVSVINTAKYIDSLKQKDEGHGFSPINSAHLKLIVHMSKKLVKKNLVPIEHIGVMVPFRNTVYDVRNELYRNGYEDIEVGTVHTFQGREKEVIIFDTVMSGEKQRGIKRHYSVRPFDEEKNGLAVPRLLNVAFSRSKQRLVILADMEHINKVYQDKYLGKLLAKFPTIG